VEEDGKIAPRIKLSENIEKVTNPGYKTVWRLFNKENNMAIADVLTLADEIIDDSKEYEIFDPIYTWKRKTITNFYAKKLQVPVILNGECVYKSPNLETIRSYCIEQVSFLWDEVKRFTNPQDYYVDLSPKLWNLKNDMINKFRSEK
ncbi:MAG: nicotinate phosphoribosyltransferase, partial [Clostridium celatum]|nr:nicotinate phosphoribosyltransferase [Clostridium celatum]